MHVIYENIHKRVFCSVYLHDGPHHLGLWLTRCSHPCALCEEARAVKVRLALSAAALHEDNPESPRRKHAENAGMCRVRGVVITLISVRTCTHVVITLRQPNARRLGRTSRSEFACRVQANTNPQIPMFSEGCCRIWLALVILGI